MEHLTLADEIVVLMLDDETGAIRPLCAGFANVAIAGGILMELALQGRIDTDLKSLYVIDPKPVGDEIARQCPRAELVEMGYLEGYRLFDDV